MSESNSSYDEIIVESNCKEQALKYLPHWPAVNIDFEDVVYTVDHGFDSKYFLIISYLFFNLFFLSFLSYHTFIS